MRRSSTQRVTHSGRQTEPWHQTFLPDDVGHLHHRVPTLIAPLRLFYHCGSWRAYIDRSGSQLLAMFDVVFPSGVRATRLRDLPRGGTVTFFSQAFSPWRQNDVGGSHFTLQVRTTWHGWEVGNPLSLLRSKNIRWGPQLSLMLKVDKSTCVSSKESICE